MPLDPGSTFPVFGVIFAVVAVIIVFVAAIVVSLIVRNARRVRQAGYSPLTLQSDLAVKLLDSSALAADKPLAKRLSELDALLAAGTITADEHTLARTQVLGSA